MSNIFIGDPFDPSGDRDAAELDSRPAVTPVRDGVHTMPTRTETLELMVEHDATELRDVLADALADLPVRFVREGEERGGFQTDEQINVAIQRVQGRLALEYPTLAWPTPPRSLELSVKYPEAGSIWGPAECQAELGLAEVTITPWIFGEVGAPLAGYKVRAVYDYALGEV